MQVQEGVWYRTRDGRKAEVKNNHGISDVLVDGKRISTVFTDCGTNDRVNPSDSWDIVALWDDTNADGTYKLPDESISPCWRNDKGILVCRSSNQWLGSFGMPSSPSEGRWLPLTEPVFPQRKKCSVRLCEATTCDGKRQMLAWVDGRPWEFVSKTDGYTHKNVSDIRWLTPEYEDELEAKQA